MPTLRELWNQRFGSSYVDITRDDFEEWLDSTYRKWMPKSGTVGVYLIPLSPHVAVQVSSTQASGGRSVGYAKGSMQTRLVSLHSGQVLNKKAQGKSHYKRTKNWRANLEKGIATIKDVYLKSQSFYDGIAKVEDRGQYRDDFLSKIEGYPGWSSNTFLSSLHEKVTRGMVLTKKQEQALDKVLSKAPAPTPAVDEPAAPTPNQERLDDLRKLWVAAKRGNDRWLMTFVESVGKQYKTRGTLSQKQISLLEDKFRQYGI